MEFYELSTDIDYWEHYGDGEGGISFIRDAHSILLSHENDFSKKEFDEHVKKAFQEAIKKAPNRIRAVVNMEQPDIHFDDIVQSICELFGYKKIVPKQKKSLERNVIFDHKQGEMVVFKNILIKEKKKVATPSAPAFVPINNSDDVDFDEIFKEFFEDSI